MVIFFYSSLSKNTIYCSDQIQIQCDPQNMESFGPELDQSRILFYSLYTELDLKDFMNIDGLIKTHKSRHLYCTRSFWRWIFNLDAELETCTVLLESKDILRNLVCASKSDTKGSIQKRCIVLNFERKTIILCLINLFFYLLEKYHLEWMFLNFI